MKLKLIRIANIFNPSFQKSFILLFAVIVLGTICFKFRLDFILSGVILLLIYSVLFPILNYPKYIELYDNYICYTSSENLPRKRGKGFISVKVNYQVVNIMDFSLEQSKIERVFGFAHIVFRGQTTLNAGKHTDRFQPKDVHCVYGILYKKHKSIISLYSQKTK